jgi:hypothetical protein
VPTGTVTWEAVLTLWGGSNVTFYNWARDVQGRGADNRAALYRLEGGVEIKVPEQTLLTARSLQSQLTFVQSMVMNDQQANPAFQHIDQKMDAHIAALTRVITNDEDSNLALTELRGGVSATVSGLSGLTTFVQDELKPSGNSKLDDVIARLQRIEDKVDALAAP